MRQSIWSLWLRLLLSESWQEKMVTSLERILELVLSTLPFSTSPELFLAVDTHNLVRLSRFFSLGPFLLLASRFTPTLLAWFPWLPSNDQIRHDVVADLPSFPSPALGALVAGVDRWNLQHRVFYERQKDTNRTELKLSTLRWLCSKARTLGTGVSGKLKSVFTDFSYLYINCQVFRPRSPFV